ncbi:ribosome maturation factor RimP [Lagierella sp.]|uniref:ribosome maturation factor RimP n=1 Tax=Lagierella sp. TaxID=2849657 RepID=UPI002602C532|nr:ribosome maturation factor RimP [Lagierella sp.]
MNKKELLNLCKEEFEPLLKELGLELYDIEYSKDAIGNILRIFISKDEGNVGIEDCEKASKSISQKLDLLDPIEESYFLEVSSPGIDKPFKKEKDYVKNIGKKVEVKFYGSFKGQKTLIGVLLEKKENEIVIETDKGNEKIPLDMISTVKLSLF